MEGAKEAKGSVPSPCPVPPAPSHLHSPAKRSLDPEFSSRNRGVAASSLLAAESTHAHTHARAHTHTHTHTSRAAARVAMATYSYSKILWQVPAPSCGDSALSGLRVGKRAGLPASGEGSLQARGGRVPAGAPTWWPKMYGARVTVCSGRLFPFASPSLSSLGIPRANTTPEARVKGGSAEMQSRSDRICRENQCHRGA